MPGLYKLPIDLQKNMMLFIGILSKFDVEGSFSLNYSFSKAQIKRITEGLLKSYFPRIFKTYKLQLAIRMRGFSGWCFHFDIFVFLGFFPDIGDSCHIAINIECQQVLVVVKTVYFFYSFNQVSEVEAEWIVDIVEETFVIAFKNCLSRSHLHNFNDLAQIFGFLKTSFDSHHPINRHISKSSSRPMLIKLITYLSINPKAEIVTKMLFQIFSSKFLLLILLNLRKTSIFEHLYLHFPQIKIFLFRFFPLSNQHFQLLKRVLGEGILRGTPAQIAGEVVSGSQRNDCQAYFLGIDVVFGHL